MDSIRDDVQSDVDHIKWAIVNALVRSITETTQPLEDFYYHFRYVEPADVGSIQAGIQEEIDRQASVQEDLESVLMLLDDLQEE